MDQVLKLWIPGTKDISRTDKENSEGRGFETRSFSGEGPLRGTKGKKEFKTLKRQVLAAWGNCSGSGKKFKGERKEK